MIAFVSQAVTDNFPAKFPVNIDSDALPDDDAITVKLEKWFSIVAKPHALRYECDNRDSKKVGKFQFENLHPSSVL